MKEQYRIISVILISPAVYEARDLFLVLKRIHNIRGRMKGAILGLHNSFLMSQAFQSSRKSNFYSSCNALITYM